MSVFAEMAVSDQRQSLRRIVNSKALLVRSKDQPATGAIIRDLSQSGARVAMSNNPHKPHDMIYLINLMAGDAHEAEVVWKSPIEMGCFFSRSFVLDGTTPHDLLYLREMWSQAA